jgi:ADP-ribose pyrophosphatase YjhB (NUDIX family)
MKSEIVAKSAYMPPWDYTFREGIPCAFCGNAETIVLLGPGALHGICEPCSAHVHWVWRLLPGEAPPVEASKKPQRVKVLAGKLYTPSGDLPVVPEVAGCYQFAMVRRGDAWDLPSADVGDGEGAELVAVREALAEAGLGSWPTMLEPLYTGYAPRGRLVKVYLARSWYAIVPDNEPQFRPWPVSDHVGSAAGFYLALEQVFPLRLWKHMAKEPRPDAVTFKVRHGAVEYARVQEKIRRGEEADASCLDLLYQRMTDDERFVVKQLAETSEREVERATDEASAAEVSTKAAVAGDEEVELDEGDEEVELDEGDDGEGEIPAEVFKDDGSDK